MTEGISTDVERFVGDHVHSVGQLEVLLLLHRTEPKDWSAEAVARELRIAVEPAATWLEGFHSRGFLEVAPASAPVYRFSPEGQHVRVIGDLADTFATRPVSLISLIYSKPADSVRQFADAFKIRRRDDDG